MIRAGIIGGGGYTAGELVRLLLNHPEVQIVFVHSNSQAGSPVAGGHSGLEGETDLIFIGGAAPVETIDVLFLCTPHGDSRKYLNENIIPASLKIIDLSTDYRKKDETHDFVYGLPELNRETISQSQHIANPGCFATAIQLALLPSAKEGRLGNEVHVHALTGSTGAGAIPSTTTHFSWRSDNISIYKPFTHQHLGEIRQTLGSLGWNGELNFIPLRGDFTRGIFATVYFNTPLSLDEAHALYSEYYRPHPFIVLAGSPPDLKQAVNTNKCILHLHKNGEKLLITSIIDNLLKGAAGQSVQNMNLLFGLDERTGLRLKPSAF
ncbi:MAG: N-acetyl-gamma-glutamyl-phosphate reductase [Tannerellaceae bacterium]|jgi:N-acetyl-gamma-glutamyl-phosphate reductase|nr:N-acetyl-gamma-glutamyl-phosphate reductase [Tannerellaceae bacterium]